MPALIALVALVALLLWWGWRRGRAERPGPDLPDASPEVRRAASRTGFRHQPGRPVAECVTDARLAAMGIVAAVSELDGPITRDEIEQMVIEAQVTFGVDKRTAEDIVLVGRWLAYRSGARSEAIRRLAQCVARLEGSAAAPDLLRMAEAAAAHRGPIDARAEAALDAIRRAFAVKA
jgi:hypothetical protein